MAGQNVGVMVCYHYGFGDSIGNLLLVLGMMLGYVLLLLGNEGGIRCHDDIMIPFFGSVRQLTWISNKEECDILSITAIPPSFQLLNISINTPIISNCITITPKYFLNYL